MERNVRVPGKEDTAPTRRNWRGFVALSVCLLGLLILLAVPGSSAARGTDRLAAVRVQPQQVELEDGSTARFLVNLNVLEDGAGRGHLQVRPAEGELKWARYRVEQARVICGDEGPAGVWLSGTVQQRAATARPTTSTFTARVTPDTEIEECLFFDFAGPVVTEQTARVEAEGVLRFTANACDNGASR